MDAKKVDYTASPPPRPDRRLPGVADLRAHPKDMARWAFWVPFRNWLDPRRPRRLKRLWPLWRLQHAAAGSQMERLEDEYRCIFGSSMTEPEYRALLRDAYRVAFRVHLEELLLGRLDVTTMTHFLDLKGRANLDNALKRGRGAVILSAHAGSFMLPIAALSLLGYPYTQYAARGMPPADVAAAHPEAVPVNWWLERARAVREESEDRLPANFITLKTPARELYRRLANNELVALAFDGRMGNRWVRAPFLGREALLNPGAYRLAAATGAAIVPTLCHTPENSRSVCVLGEPIYAEGRPWQVLMKVFLRDHAEPWLRHYPQDYGTWLAHCRLRKDIDDHPLFVDQVQHERWKKHPALDV